MPSTLLLDGAMGTALLGRGLPQGVLPEAWLLDRPADVEAVHAAHARAGARVALTCTFNLAAPRLGPLAARVDALAAAAVRCARAGGAARVAGAVGPLAAEGDAGGRYRRAFEALAAAGAELLWAETQYDLAEARAALAAARATGLPAVVTLTYRDGERLPGGGAARDALLALAAEGAAAVGVNCVAAGPALEALVAELAPRLGIPFVAKPSPGLPGAVAAPAPFARAVARLAAAGAAWIGGCCGATAEHVAAVAAATGQSPRG